MPNCSRLESLADFDEYLYRIRAETSFDESNLALCHREICVAVFGEGNPDISGIGVGTAFTIPYTVSLAPPF